MVNLDIEYGHEFISNNIKDELLLNDIWDFKKLEIDIIKTVKELFSFDIGISRNINTLSGGQRSLTFLITFCFILKKKNIEEAKLVLKNILESLSDKSKNIAVDYLKEHNIYVA